MSAELPSSLEKPPGVVSRETVSGSIAQKPDIKSCPPEVLDDIMKTLDPICGSIEANSHSIDLQGFFEKFGKNLPKELSSYIDKISTRDVLVILIIIIAIVAFPPLLSSLPAVCARYGLSAMFSRVICFALADTRMQTSISFVMGLTMQGGKNIAPNLVAGGVGSITKDIIRALFPGCGL